MIFLPTSERWDPFEELNTLRNGMDRRRAGANPDDAFALACLPPTPDMIESREEIVIKANLLGIDENNVDVEIDRGVLTIKGERDAEKRNVEKDSRRAERSYGSFLRSFPLPPSVEPEKVSAAFVNGLLEVHLPKKESAKPRPIKIDIRKQLAPSA